ncbi:SPX domain-containing protein [Methylobacter tundripaludum]|uniref:hypothetical protein n=1 Tax=Methylobacter tundripaludum TaxID=173365 RepID=UPI000AED3832|nr:hypothetical protein [Methylobacter tundripaludum]
MNLKLIKDSAINTAFAALSEQQSQYLSQALDSYASALKSSISKASISVDEITKQSLAVKQGFLAEAHHTASYNIEAAARGVNNIKADMDSLSAIDQVIDIRITSASSDSVDFQLKFYKDGEASAKAFHPTKQPNKYADVGKVVPGDQLDEAIDKANREALRNQQTRPDVSQNYDHTAKNATDTISHPDRPDIKSQSLNRKGPGGSEDLTKTIEKGEKPEYQRSKQVQQELQGAQYANAAVYGALSGLITSSVSQLYDALTSEEKLTENDYMAMAEQIIKGTVSGSGKALLTTGIQHAGKELLKNSSKEALKAIGEQLSKGNIAANVAILTTQLGHDLYRMSRGEIDGIELADSTINTSIGVTASAGGYVLGVEIAGWVGPMISSTVAETAVMGTTLGAMGPIALGVLGGIAVSVVMGAYCNHFASQGSKIAIADIELCMTALQSGEMSLASYTGTIGSMSEFEFGWNDIWPLSGTFSVLGEYKARKQQLMSVQSEIASRRAHLSEREAEILYAMQANYQTELLKIDNFFEEKQRELFAQAEGMFHQLEKELDDHLQVQFALHHAANSSRFAELHYQNSKIQKVEHLKERLKIYTGELIQLKENLAAQEGLKPELKFHLQAVLELRLSNVLPATTPHDIAFNFIYGDQEVA